MRVICPICNRTEWIDYNPITPIYACRKCNDLWAVLGVTLHAQHGLWLQARWLQPVDLIAKAALYFGRRAAGGYYD